MMAFRTKLSFVPIPTDDKKMMMDNSPKRVRLTCDLTRYDKRCTKDSLGWTMPYIHAQWGIMVRYDSGAVLDTLWRSLEVLGEKKDTKEAKEACLLKFQGTVISLLDQGMSADAIRQEVTKVKKNVAQSETEART